MNSSAPGGEIASAGLPLPQRSWAVVAISLNTLMVVIDSAILTVALPTAARSLSVTQSEVIALVAITQIIALVALLPFAAFGDRIGHSRLYKFGQAVFIVGSLLCMAAPTFTTLLAARAVQAVGAAAVLSVGMALLRAIYPSTMLGRGLGINGILIAIGAAIAPSLGGVVVATLGWRWVFVCALPLAVGSMLLGKWLPRSARGQRDFDVRGALHYAMTAALIAAAFSTFAYGGPAWAAAALLASALVVGAVFVRRELQRPRPILPIDLLARPVFGFAIGAAFAAFTGATTMLLSLPFLLEGILGPNPVKIGAVMMAWPLAMMVSAPIAAALSDRLPGGLLSCVGVVLAFCGFTLLALLSADVSHAQLIPSIALCGLGMGFFISPNSRLLISATPSDRTASVGGLISTTRILGQSTGAAIVALLMQPWLAKGAAAPQIAASLAGIAGLLSLAHLLPANRRHLAPRSGSNPQFSDDEIT